MSSSRYALLEKCDEGLGMQWQECKARGKEASAVTQVWYGSLAVRGRGMNPLIDGCGGIVGQRPGNGMRAHRGRESTSLGTVRDWSLFCYQVDYPFG